MNLQSSKFGLEKVGLFAAADVFVYPSYHEGMPIAVLEAMACGLPIVATRVGGLVDLVEDGVNGVLVDPGRADQLAAVLHRLAFDEPLRRAMGAKSVQLAREKYDVERLVDRLLHIYREVLSETSS